MHLLVFINYLANSSLFLLCFVDMMHHLLHSVGFSAVTTSVIDTDLNHSGRPELSPHTDVCLQTPYLHTELALKSFQVPEHTVCYVNE